MTPAIFIPFIWSKAVLIMWVGLKFVFFLVNNLTFLKWVSEERGKETQQKKPVNTARITSEPLMEKNGLFATCELYVCKWRVWRHQVPEKINNFMVLKANSHSNKISLWISDNEEWGAGWTGFNFYFYRSNYNIGLYIINSWGHWKLGADFNSCWKV